MIKRVTDLQPGMKIVSKKKTDWYELSKKFFNWRILRKAIQEFGENVVFGDANHIRTVIGRIGKHVIVFHWTFPVARFEIAKSWMLDPEYAVVARHKFKAASMEQWHDEAMLHESTGYDLGQLLDIDFGFKRFFDFGNNKNVCSSGAGLLDFKVLGVQFKTPIEKLLPCYPLNDPENYTILNIDTNKIISHVFKVEPCQKTVRV